MADEVGALRTAYPIQAMESSQMNMLNRLGILISTAYESLENPMTTEVDYCQRVLEGKAKDDSLFSLLYMPDDSLKWMEDDELLKANPLCYDVPENLEYLKKKRDKVIEVPSDKKNFLTKHMNIFVEGNDGELFVRNEDLIRGSMPEGQYDWNGKEVYVGVDLATSDDNVAVTMVAYDEYTANFYSKSWAFIPAFLKEEKSKKEKHDYDLDIADGTAFACGDRIISYLFVEQFVMDLESVYGVVIKGIGYDRHNCISSVGKWEAAGYDCREVRQISSVTHYATKLLKECVVSERFFYDENRLYEINFSNAREFKDTNLNIYINKKLSNGKVDMAVATVDAMVLWELDIREGGSSYENRGILSL